MTNTEHTNRAAAEFIAPAIAEQNDTFWAAVERPWSPTWYCSVPGCYCRSSRPIGQSGSEPPRRGIKMTENRVPDELGSLGAYPKDKIDRAARANHGTDLSNAEYAWVLGRIDDSGLTVDEAVAEVIEGRRDL